MRFVLAAVFVLFIQDAPGAVHIGTVGRQDNGWTFQEEGSDGVSPLKGANPTGMNGKRVQLLGDLTQDGWIAKTLDLLFPPAKDLELKLRAKGSKASLMEYFPQAGHKHAGRSCRIHAWPRAMVEAKDGVIVATLKVPAYEKRPHVHIFVRVESATEGGEAVESDDWYHDGEVWKNKAMDDVKSAEVELEAP